MSKKPKTREEILQEAVEGIKKKFGEGAIMRLGERPVHKVDMIPTGILLLDLITGIGGLPRGRIVEIYGPEGTGKTTISLHAIAEAQKAGGIAAFIDAEHALDPKLAKTIGVDIESLYISQPDNGEQALSIAETLIYSGTVDIIVVDSVAALVPQAEILSKMGDSQVGAQARLMSYALRRLTAAVSKSRTTLVFINQLRAQISSGYSPQGPSETTAGGRALKFYSSMRIDVRKGLAIKKGEEIIGTEVKVKISKNKMAPPFRSCNVTLVYGKGFPRAVGIIDAALNLGIVRKRGSWLGYKGENIGQGRENAADFLNAHPDIMDEMLKEILSTLEKQETPSDALYGGDSGNVAEAVESDMGSMPVIDMDEDIKLDVEA